MSNTIDTNVVAMKFDNSNFENNVKQSMSTLDKLKQKLNLSGASKGLQALDTAAKGLTFATATKAVDTLQVKIDALGIAGVSAISGITNSLVGMAKSAADVVTGMSAIKSGFSEYQTQLGAIQTIMSNTSSKGTTLDEVNSALDELNHYADKTIYNFTEMTKNIGTFTAAGVDLDTAVSSIKGIANLAAASGSSSLQASTAMYQLSQAIAAGKVQLMDWNSVVNAGMGGELFQNALKRTAEHFGTDVDGMIEKYGSFRESLTSGGWLTVDVLTETLKQISGAYTEADLISQGYTEDQAKAIADLATTAENAATKVKTFSELFDTIEEAASSGWTETWELFFGDFDYAKENLTWFSEYFSKTIQSMSDSRNNLLKPALDSNWDRIIDTLEEANVDTEVFSTKVKQNLESAGYNVTDLMNKYGTLENIFKSGEVTTDSLKQAIDELSISYSDLSDVAGTFSFGSGFDSNEGDENIKKIQSKLIALGYDLGNFGDQADGVDGQLGDMTEAAIRSFQELNGLEVDGIVGPETLQALQDATVETEDLHGKIDGLIDGVDELGGRDRIFQGIKNIIQAAAKVADVARASFENVFPPVTSENIYNAIVKFEQFTEKLTMSDETADKLQRAFQGLFSIVKIVATLVGGPLKIGFTIVQGICKLFGTDVLTLAANIGDAIVSVKDWIDNFGKIPSVADGVSSFIQGIIDTFQNLKDFFTGNWSGSLADCFQPLIDGITTLKDGIWAALKDTPVGDFITWCQGIVDSIKNAISDAQANGIGSNFVQGIINGIQNGIQSLIDKASELATNILSTVKGVLGIHSPSTEGESIGNNFVQGIINGITGFASKLAETVKNLGVSILDTIKSIDFSSVGESIRGIFDSIVDAVKNFDFTAVIPVLIGGGLIAAFAVAGKIIGGGKEKLVSPIQNVFDAIGTIADSLKEDKLTKKANAMKGFATAIAIVAAAVLALAYGISKDAGAVWGAVGVITVLAAVIGGISLALEKLGTGSGLDASGIGAMLTGLAVVLGVMAGVVYVLGQMSPAQVTQGTIVAVLLSALIVGILAVVKLMSGSDKFGSAGGNFSALLGIAVAIGALALVVKTLGSMDPGQLQQGLASVTTLSFLVAGLITVSRLAKSASGVGSALLGVAVAMGVMAILIAVFAKMNPADFDKGYECVAKLSLIVAGLMIVNGIAGRIAGGNSSNSLLGVAVVIGVMGVIVKLLSGMSPEDFDRGYECVAKLSGLVAMLMIVSALAGNMGKGAGATSLLAIAVVIGVMAGIAIVLGYLDPSKIQNGIEFVTQLTALVAILVYASKYSKKAKIGPIIAIVVGIGVLAAAVAVLSFLDPAAVQNATDCMTKLLAMFAIITFVSQYADGSVATLLVITLAIGVIGACLYALATLPTENALAASDALTTCMLGMAVMLAVVGGIGKVSGSALIALGVVTGVVVVLAVVLGLMTALDVAPSIDTAVALSIMLISMSIVLAILSAIGTNATGAMAAAGSLDGVIAIIGGFLIAVGALMENVPQAQEFLNTGLQVLSDLAHGIGKAIGELISGLSDGAYDGLEDIGTRLSNFMLNMQPFFLLSQLIPDNLIEKVGLIAGAVLAMCETEIASALTDFLTGGNGGDSMIQKMQDLGTGLAEFSQELNGIDMDALQKGADAASKIAELINAIPTEGGIAGFLFGEKDLSGFFDSLTQYGQGIAGFGSAINEVEFDQSKVDAVGTLAQALADMNEVVPTTGGLASMLFGEKDMGEFGTRAKSFGEGLRDFAAAANEITPIEDTTGIQNTVDLLKSMNDAVPTEGGLMSLIEGQQNFDTFGNKVSSFAGGIKSFAESLQGFTGEGINYDAVKSCAEGIANMNDVIPNTGGVLQWFVGAPDMGKFGADAGVFGLGLLSFATACEGFPSDINFDDVSKCVEMLAGMGDVVGNSGGVLDNVIDWFVGKPDFQGFKENSVLYADAIKEFGNACHDFPDDINFDQVSACTTALSNMSSVVSSGNGTDLLDTVLSWFGKHSDFDDFKSNSVKYAEALLAFATACHDFPDDVNFDKVSQATEAIGKMNEVVMAGSGDFKSGLFSEAGAAFTKFSSNGVNFANALKDFAAACSGIVTDGLQGAQDAINAITSLTNSDVIYKGDDLETFGGKLASFGGKLGDFMTNSASFDPDKVNNMVTALGGLKQFADDGFNADNINLDGLGDKLAGAMGNEDTQNRISSAGETLGKALVMGFGNESSLTDKMDEVATNAINTAYTYMSQFKDAGQGMADKLGEGAGLSVLLVTNISTLCSDAASAASGYYQSFYDSGYNMVSGLIDGLNARYDAVSTAAANLANKAKDALNAAAQIHSPSRVWMRSGGYMGQGLAIGITNSTKQVRESSERLADVANNAALQTIAAYGAIDSIDFDSTPVIRPVIDLSDVQNGVKYIDNAFSYRSVGKLGAAIDATLDASSNDDVIAAINRLGTNIDNMPRNTYTVGDVSYDDGSTTARAVSELTRAIKIRRRS